MSEISLPVEKKRGAIGRRKKLSTKVDLTPMVDLGFLLITFFVFTTKLAEPTTLKLSIPADGAKTKVKDKEVLSAIPINKNRIFYFFGDLNEALSSGAFGITNFSADRGIGAIIRQKQFHMNTIAADGRRNLTVIIKPSKISSYGNVVDLLDEMAINNVQRFVLTDIQNDEEELLVAKGFIQ